MGKGKKFKNQSKDEIIKHLTHILKPDIFYNLFADPLGIHIEIEESIRQPKQESEKLKMLRYETQHLSKKKRRQAGTRKRTKPKIRSIKKGRTVNLKGVNY